MCSIFGFVGPYPDMRLLGKIREAASDRGRDGGRMESYLLRDGSSAFLGNWRATPTPEVEKGPLQPYDGLVHNGTIANDKELGGRDGEIDSQVLARVLNRSGVYGLVESLKKVKGSYALACRNERTVLLASNYKPIHYYSEDGENWYFSSMARHLQPFLPRGQAPVVLPPYSALDLLTGEAAAIPRQGDESRKALVVCSAGLDSTTVAYDLQAKGWEVGLLHFLYGCKAENKEVARIKLISAHLQAPAYFLRIPYGEMGKGSSLMETGDRIVGGIEGAEFAHEWVPARNLILFSLAVAFAEANGYHAVALGNNLEEAGAYPDNEEQMTLLLDQACPYFVQNGYAMRVLSPVGHLMKHEVVALGLRLGVPYDLTWSCYRSGKKHCGRCGPCFMRREAFRRNGAVDPVFQEE